MDFFIAVLGYLAGILSVITFIPQAIKTLKTKQTKHFTLSTYLIYNCANILFLLFGILSIALPVMWPAQATKNQIIIWGCTLIIPYAVTIMASSCIIYVKVKNILIHGEKTIMVKE